MSFRLDFDTAYAPKKVFQGTSKAGKAYALLIFGTEEDRKHEIKVWATNPDAMMFSENDQYKIAPQSIKFKSEKSEWNGNVTWKDVIEMNATVTKFGSANADDADFFDLLEDEEGLPF